MCKFCEGKEDISNKRFEDGSTYSDHIMQVNIKNDLFFKWSLVVAPVKYRDGKATKNERHYFSINYCPKCGKKLDNKGE